MIEVLEGPNGLVEDQKGMLDIVVAFYKKLFAREERGSVRLANDFWQTEDLITSEENDLLTMSFTEKEIKEVVFSCYSDGAPGPDLEV